jgi:hypothetical protein
MSNEHDQPEYPSDASSAASGPDPSATPLESPPATTEAGAPVWPHAAADDGQIYTFLDPNHRPESTDPQRMVAMTIETYIGIRDNIKMLHDQVVETKAANIKLFQELQERPAKKDGPTIITPASGIRRPN